MSEDPAVRESALDDMYDALHDQGGILAVIPFLLAAAGRADLPGRAEVVELLAAVGARDGEPGPAEERVVEAVRAAFPLFASLLHDPEPAVRAAACEALAVCRGDAARAVGKLGERLPVETDADVRAAIVVALGTIGASGGLTAEAGSRVAARLAGVAVEHADPAVRLAALAELAGFAPKALPDDVPSVAVEGFAQLYAEDAPTVGPAGREVADRRAYRLLTRLSGRLEDRVEDRTRLLVPLLESADWAARLDAVQAAEPVIEHWRGDHRELVRLIGHQLLSPEPRLPPVAATALRYLGPVAGPAADALARSIDAAPREAPHTTRDGPPAWITTWRPGSSTTGPTVRALAASRDPRAVEPVLWALERPEPPTDIGHVVRALGPLAAGFVPLVRARLRDRWTPDSAHDGLLVALGELGEAAASAVPDIVRHLPERAALRALRALGAHAAVAAPALRDLLGHAEPRVAVDAAAALWRVEGDADRVLPTLLGHLDRVTAVEVIADLGPAAAGYLPALRALLDRPDPAGWRELHVARALWRAAGDAEAALPLLTAAWHRNPHVRVAVVRCLAEMGPAAAPAAPMLREELARRRRHTSTGSGWSSDQVVADEELQRLCRDVLAAF
ncbi:MULTISPECIES: HEAT repeat domain-containing protein [Saccharothrix]|uniref:HEAT repeat domain-containing protein n=1 Tax=Saccharothrix TaxID=2071 RepID=UPI001160ED17|nr:HEAT repeat domain-containing protein [Saccharothrix sp. CB00851]